MHAVGNVALDEEAPQPDAVCGGYRGGAQQHLHNVYFNCVFFLTQKPLAM